LAKQKQQIDLDTMYYRRECDDFEKKVAVEKQTKLRQIKEAFFNSEQRNKTKLQDLELAYRRWNGEQENDLLIVKAKKEQIEQESLIEMEKVTQSLALRRDQDVATRKRKNDKYNLTKSIYRDPILLEMEYLRAQKKIYERSCHNVKIHQMDGQDPYATQLKSFVASAM